jgi:death on curing protein
MTQAVRYLSVDEVIALHALIMDETGWQPAPLRAPGLLQSAVLRAQNLAHYQDADLVEQASSLGIGISQNQPFLDGNKRTAYVVMLTFLEANDYTVEAAPLEIAERLVRVAERASDREAATEEFNDWIRDRLRPIEHKM